MVLGLGYGDLLVVAVVAAVLVGPNDVPKVARLAGRATGRAVSLVSRFRDRAVDLAGASEAGRLARDLSRATRALEAVGADLRGGVSLRGGGGRGGRAAAGAAAAAAGAAPVAGSATTAAPYSFAASPLAAPSRGGAPQQGGGVQVLEISAEAVRSAARQRTDSSSSSSSSSSSPSPSRRFSVVTGSDVAAEALEEEAVSEMAAKFLGTGRQQQQWRQRQQQQEQRE